MKLFYFLCLLIWNSQALATSMSDLDIMVREQVVNNLLENRNIELDFEDIEVTGFGPVKTEPNCEIIVNATAKPSTNNEYDCKVCFEQVASLMGFLNLEPTNTECNKAVSYKRKN